MEELQLQIETLQKQLQQKTQENENNKKLVIKLTEQIDQYHQKHQNSFFDNIENSNENSENNKILKLEQNVISLSDDKKKLEEDLFFAEKELKKVKQEKSQIEIKLQNQIIVQNKEIELLKKGTLSGALRVEHSEVPRGSDVASYDELVQENLTLKHKLEMMKKSEEQLQIQKHFSFHFSEEFKSKLGLDKTLNSFTQTNSDPNDVVSQLQMTIGELQEEKAKQIQKEKTFVEQLYELNKKNKQYEDLLQQKQKQIDELTKNVIQMMKNETEEMEKYKQDADIRR